MLVGTRGVRSLDPFGLGKALSFIVILMALKVKHGYKRWTFMSYNTFKYTVLLEYFIFIVLFMSFYSPRL